MKSNDETNAIFCVERALPGGKPPDPHTPTDLAMEGPCNENVRRCPLQCTNSSYKVVTVLETTLSVAYSELVEGENLLNKISLWCRRYSQFFSCALFDTIWPDCLQQAAKIQESKRLKQ